ncbi:MAG: TonB-dependent receptor [Proteobacteria bacterium]|nr:TonB-dependent receptor [Pseudomonadota bacterium]HQR04411.1 TonB-dependent receptor [Rhodocyclaceae bacterium]
MGKLQKKRRVAGYAKSSWALLTYTVASATCAATGNTPAEPMLEEVVVTAQKRSERLQDVPVAISAFTTDQIVNRGIANVLDLSALAPNLGVSKAPNSNTSSQIAIRGMITVNPAIYWEPSVGMYLDGIYLGKAIGSVTDVVDLERIEVLRGPQGTLYGRNTIGGAINLVTRKPSGEFGGSASLDFGNYGAQISKLSLDLPKIGIASLSFGARLERRDALVKGNAGSKANGFDSKNNDAFHVAATFDLAPNLKAEYQFDRSKTDQNAPFNQLYNINTGGAISAVMAGKLAPYVSHSRPTSGSVDFNSYERMQSDGHGLTVSWAISDTDTLKSITSHRTLRVSDSFDLDGTPVLVYNGGRRSNYSQTSQEFQWTGSTPRLNYVAGLYFFRDQGYTSNPHWMFYGTDVSEYGTGASARAVYGQLDFKATDALTLTVGMRYNHETKYGSRYLIKNNAVSIPPLYGTAEYSSSTPMFSAAYRFSDHLNVYARYAEGYRSGGFNGEAGTAVESMTPYQPEKLKTYEVGAKMISADGRFQANVALFQNKSEDMQISIFGGTPGVSLLRNAGKATVRGLELDGAYLPFDGLKLRMGLGLLDAKFDEFLEPAAVGQPPSNVASNRAFPRAPKRTFNLSADARLARTDWGVVKLFADYTYTSSLYSYPYQLTTVDPTRANAESSKVDGYGLMNMRLSLTQIPLGSASGRAEVAFWVRNLTDKSQPVNFIDFGPLFGNLRTAYFLEPRTYGVSLGYRW